ncbi:MAG: DNA recombination protein RmuC [Chromatiales bacterium]|nr:DNA recombination protein RmuC [Gammaproteobacteria bacterium]MBW6476319.1 DNA recombination protein RmuC [Chromatiales bacterium]
MALTTESYLLLTLAALLVGALGFLLGWLPQQRKYNSVREENIRINSDLESERNKLREVQAAHQQARQQLTDSFNALAADALKRNSSEFLKLADERFKQLQIHASRELGEREKAVENLVKPIRETLEKTEQQIRQMEKDREQAYGSLSKYLESMGESQRLLQQETRNLVQALRRPEVRGQWGEMTLKRLAELAGMVEHCDFFEQEQRRDGEGKAQRPDMIVRMPDNRELIVDAKTPLDAYLSAINASSDEERQLHLQHHARKVRERVRELASKAYWQQFKNTPDFVVLFIPGEQFLGAALEQDHSLLEDAMADRVILATPTTLIALLRAVAYGWRQQALAENAETIRELGEELYGRLATFAEHLGKLGKSLDSSVSHFNKAVGSFDTRILPSARKFTEMGIHSKKPVEALSPIELASRPLQGEDN